MRRIALAALAALLLASSPLGADEETAAARNRRVRHALDAALEWLAAHQSDHGGWDAAGFVDVCRGRRARPSERSRGAGKPVFDVGVTGLAVDAFLAAGHGPGRETEHAEVVDRGLAHLLSQQDPEGCFGARMGPNFIYNHGCATLAMVRAAARAEGRRWRRPAQSALDFHAACRNPYFGWRYGVKPGDNDTSVTALMLRGLVRARAANDGRTVPLLTIDEQAFDGAMAWLEKVTDPDYGRVGYITRGSGPARPAALVDAFPHEHSESMTAAGLVIREHAAKPHHKRNEEMVAKGAGRLVAKRPRWTSRGTIDLYYWHYGTLALAGIGDGAWRTWRRALLAALLDNQRRDGTVCTFRGSWDPVGPWGPEGGRVYSTALVAATLAEVLRADGALDADDEIIHPPMPEPVRRAPDEPYGAWRIDAEATKDALLAAWTERARGTWERLPPALREERIRRTRRMGERVAARHAAAFDVRLWVQEPDGFVLELVPREGELVKFQGTFRREDGRLVLRVREASGFVATVADHRLRLRPVRDAGGAPWVLLRDDPNPPQAEEPEAGEGEEGD